MSSCGVPSCTKSMSGKGFKITCGECNKCFHGSCVSISKSDLDYLNSENLQWRCLPCQTERRRSMRFETSASSGSVTLEDIMQTLKVIQDEQRQTKKEFNDSYELLYKKIDDANTSLEQHRKEMQEYSAKMDKLEAENMVLRKQITQLETRFEEVEQYTRKNCVEIQGIPKEKNEDVVDIVQKVGDMVGFKIETNMIDNCHRLYSKQDGSAPGIIVKFTRFLDKEEFLAKKRAKRELSTRYMGLKSDIRIFVNESLSPARRKLHFLARGAKKEKGYTFLWTRGGKIFMRKNADVSSKVITINRPEDLDKL